MSFWTGFKVFGKDIVKVFTWMGSAKGQAVIGTGETLLETVLPFTTPLVNLFNEWAKKAYVVEALSVAAAQATGTGADKAKLAIASIVPQVLEYAKTEGLEPRTAEQLQAANDAVIAFINALTGSAPDPVGTPVPAPTTPTN